MKSQARKPRHARVAPALAQLAGRFAVVLLLGVGLGIRDWATPNPVRAANGNQVGTELGMVEGTTSVDGKIHIFKGIPFAAPPVGALRWKELQPAPRWKGVRTANEFGARCMQGRIFPDMVFRDAGPSEDCLYLNVWTPKISPKAKLPVMVWIFGGGFQAGSTSEPRQDGERLAHNGVVIVSMNYRLGVFGFFSHADLASESPHHASGNYGLLDQAAALDWVHNNIVQFGGDPENVTIFGESAGSSSVSAQMASPVSKGLIRRAIGESGAFFGRTPNAKGKLHTETEMDGTKFVETIGAKSIGALRGMGAQELLDAALKERDTYRFAPNIDGYFLPASPFEIYGKGEQAHVPLLAGWNRDERNYHQFFAKEAPTKENYTARIRQTFGDKSSEILKAFPAETNEQAMRSAGLLASADFVVYATWKWIELQRQTGGSAVFRYEFDQAPPAANGASSEPRAYHSAEIEYVFGTLDSKKLPWRSEDYKLSEQMGTYWTNFAKSGNPNGAGLPQWPPYEEKGGYAVMHLRSNPHAVPDQRREQFELLDSLAPEAPRRSGNQQFQLK